MVIRADASCSTQAKNLENTLFPRPGASAPLLMQRERPETDFSPLGKGRDFWKRLSKATTGFLNMMNPSLVGFSRKPKGGNP